MISNSVSEHSIVLKAAAMLRPGFSYIVRGTEIEWDDCDNPPTDQEIADCLDAARVEVQRDRLRVQRNALLVASDWTQMPDVATDRAAWAAYRQELRDFPSTVVDVENPVWPIPPVEGVSNG